MYKLLSHYVKWKQCCKLYILVGETAFSGAILRAKRCGLLSAFCEHTHNSSNPSAAYMRHLIGLVLI